MTLTTEESLSNSAKVLPTLLLIVLPFGIGIILSTLQEPRVLFVAVVPGLVIYVFYAHYGLASFALKMRWEFRKHNPDKASWKSFYKQKHNPYKYFEKRGYETAIYEYEYINKLLFIEVGILILLTVLFYILPDSMKKGYLDPLLGNGFYYLEVTLLMTVYFTFLSLIHTYTNRNFRFQFAIACMNVIEDKRDEVNKIYYLMKGLNSYNKFLKRNLKLYFDDAMVCSKIISSPEKNQSLILITESFKDNDKLKPVSCLSNIIKLPDEEQFLMEKRLGDKIRDAVTIGAAIIPIVISIVQLSR